MNNIENQEPKLPQIKGLSVVNKKRDFKFILKKWCQLNRPFSLKLHRGLIDI